MIFETIVRFCDADSGELIDYYGNKKMFRLINTRAPERGQVGYEKSKRIVNGMVARYKGVVTVEVNDGMDAYHRLLVLMSNPDGSINERMIQRGYC